MYFCLCVRSLRHFLIAAKEEKYAVHLLIFYLSSTFVIIADLQKKPMPCTSYSEDFPPKWGSHHLGSLKLIILCPHAVPCQIKL